MCGKMGATNPADQKMSQVATDGCALMASRNLLRRRMLRRGQRASSDNTSINATTVLEHQGVVNPRPVLIVVDTSYSLKDILARGQTYSVMCRDLDGFFDHVWTINPIAPAAYGDGIPSPTEPTWFQLSTTSTFIDGTLAVSSRLKLWPGGAALNFLLSQCRQISQMVFIARAHSSAVVRGGDPLYAGLFALIVARISARPLVIRVGSNNERVFGETGRPIMPRLFRKRHLERAVERFVLSRADAVMGANEDNLAWALASGAPQARSQIVRYGNLIDPVHFRHPDERGARGETLRAIGARPGRKTLLYVGRLEEVKRVHDLILVAEALRSSGFVFQLILVGDGSQRDALQVEIRQRKLDDFVLLVGPATQEVISDLFGCVDVVVSPHMGRALGEAALAAAPIVAYDLDWQGELVVDGETGRLIPAGDVRGFAQAVADLLSYPEEARRFGEAARKTALQLLDPKQQDDAEREVYSVVLRSASRAGPISAEITVNPEG